MKVIIIEMAIHILIGMVLFGFVFGAVFLGTRHIEEDVSQIRIDVDRIADELYIDLNK